MAVCAYVRNWRPGALPCPEVEGGTVSARVAPPWPGKWCCTAGTVHGAGQQARVTGHATVWQNRPWGFINRSGHCVHKLPDLACSTVLMCLYLSLRLEIKARGGSLQCTSPWGTFVQRFRDLLSLNNTLWSQTIHWTTPTSLNGTELFQQWDWRETTRRGRLIASKQSVCL